MSTGKQMCDRCKQLKPNVELQPSRSYLLFGGFNATYEARCRTCERKTAQWVERRLRDTASAK